MDRHTWRGILCCLMSVVFIASVGAAEGAALPTIARLNTNSANGDHAEDDLMRASLEPDFRGSAEITYADTGHKLFAEMNYPRIKQWKDDLYVLMFSTSQTGNRICYTTSTDGISWAAPTVLWAASQHPYGENDHLIASGLEACMLDNGQILCVFAVRPKWAYRYDIDANGLYVLHGCIGAGNKLIFGTPKKIYTGQCWEPSILQRADGTVEIYFTQIAPYIAKYSFDTEKRSSGTGYLVSRDWGCTWTPNIQAGDTNYYRATTVLQQYIGDKTRVIDGASITAPYFSGQMPVAVELYNGRMLLAAEVHGLDFNFTVSYALSREDGTWKALDFTEEGPDTLVESPYDTAAPYVDRFLSGETLLAYGKSAQYYARLGAADGSGFGREFNLIGKTRGSMGSIFVSGTHMVLAAFPNEPVEDAPRGTKIVRAYLNHRIDAPTQSVTVDGDAAEWKNNTDALFVGSQTQAQVTLQAAHDAENVYFLLSRLDGYLTDGDTVTVCIADGKTSDYRITVDSRGNVTGVHVENAVAKETFAAKAAVTVLGTENDNSNTDAGVLYEVAVPKALLGLDGADEMQVRLELKNRDAKDEAVITDSFTGVSYFATGLWPIVKLQF